MEPSVLRPSPAGAAPAAGRRRWASTAPWTAAAARPAPSASRPCQSAAGSARAPALSMTRSAWSTPAFMTQVSAVPDSAIPFPRLNLRTPTTAAGVAGTAETGPFAPGPPACWLRPAIPMMTARCASFPLGPADSAAEEAASTSCPTRRAAGRVGGAAPWAPPASAESVPPRAPRMRAMLDVLRVRAACTATANPPPVAREATGSSAPQPPGATIPPFAAAVAVTISWATPPTADPAETLAPLARAVFGVYAAPRLRVA
jgi:hypothetical protein